MLTPQGWEGLPLAMWESISDRGSSQTKVLRKGTTEQVREITNKLVQREHHVGQGAGRKEGARWGMVVPKWLCKPREGI